MRVKIGRFEGRITTASPEYEDASEGRAAHRAPAERGLPRRAYCKDRLRPRRSGAADVLRIPASIVGSSVQRSSRFSLPTYSKSASRTESITGPGSRPVPAAVRAARELVGQRVVHRARTRDPRVAGSRAGGGRTGVELGHRLRVVLDPQVDRAVDRRLRSPPPRAPRKRRPTAAPLVAPGLVSGSQRREQAARPARRRSLRTLSAIASTTSGPVRMFPWQQ